ncbi:hypothetical protein GOE07_01845 [Sinorhizobium medicae]|nr:hypothetical protein [Sinorhizobium medicae]MDX1028910.1 hypothetical protein [Sinorhizobium medicae]MDX1097102.1 hypothetical protein [Sinorhizobium medicae]MDX1158436.1 hypothetical protein [Sinorhizobium medicae]
MQNRFRVVEFDKGPNGGVAGMEALINEWADKGYSLHQAVRESTYRWVLIFSRNVGVEQPNSSSGS